MNVSKKSSAPGWVDPDDVPDLSTPEWAEAFKNAKVRRGRPKALVTKVRPCGGKQRVSDPPSE
jgi:hypothetical protein